MNTFNNAGGYHSQQDEHQLEDVAGGEMVVVVPKPTHSRSSDHGR